MNYRESLERQIHAAIDRLCCEPASEQGEYLRRIDELAQSLATEKEKQVGPFDLDTAVERIRTDWFNGKYQH